MEDLEEEENRKFYARLVILRRHFYMTIVLCVHFIIRTHIYGIQKDGKDNPVCEKAKETQMYKTVFWTLWERERDDLGEWH